MKNSLRGNPTHSNQNTRLDHNETKIEKNNENTGLENLVTGKSRIFVANMLNEITEEEFTNMFKKYGELSEVYLSNKGFGFFKVKSRSIAEKIKLELDGTLNKGRNIRVRIATAGTALKVLNLSFNATNEILAKAFSQFGPLDSAIVVADERGKSIGEGIVEFSKKNHAQIAMKRINEGVFYVTGSSRPVVVEPYELKDYDTGVRERTFIKTAEAIQELNKGPYFAQPGSFEYDYGNKWKALYQQEKIQRELLEKKIQDDRLALENDMDASVQEHQTILLRQDLMKKQEELRRMEESLRNRSKEPGRDNFFQNAFNPYSHQQFNGSNNFQAAPPPLPFQQNSNDFSMRNGPLGGFNPNSNFNNPSAGGTGGGFMNNSSSGGGSGGMQFNPHAMHPANKQLTPGSGITMNSTNSKKDKEQQQQPRALLSPKMSPMKGTGPSKLLDNNHSNNNDMNNNNGGGNKISNNSLMGPKPVSLMALNPNKILQYGRNPASNPSSLMGTPIAPHLHHHHHHMLNHNHNNLQQLQQMNQFMMNASAFLGSGGGGGDSHGGHGPNSSNLIDPFNMQGYDSSSNKRRRP